ncbi:MAG: AMIN domain-containing protein [Oligoflexia bacterium]|nr:AMIN domain-containing protein [Oligoflexia bacterium]
MFKAPLVLATLLVLISYGLCAADEQQIVKGTKFSLAYEAQASGVESIKIRSSGLEKVEPFLIENPARLVIDIPGQKLHKNSETALSSSHLLKAIRVGAHADKIRVVIDFKDAATPPYSSKATAGDLILTIGTPKAEPAPSSQPIVTKHTPSSTVASSPTPRSAASAVAAPKIIELKAVPTATGTARVPTAAPTSAHTSAPVPPTVTPQPVPSFTPTSTPTPTVPPTHTATTLSERTATTNSNPQGKSLLSINFDHVLTDQSAVVKFALTKPSEFRLAKQDDRSYLLTIPNCAVSGEFLKLPYFPPHDFLGLVMVQVSADGPDVKVLITVDRGIRIASVSKENELWVRPVTR